MPNILLISKDDVFATDLIGQLQHHAKNYVILEKEEAEKSDIVIIDEDLSCLNKINHKGPILFLTSKPEEINSDCAATNVLVKPLSLSEFLDELHSCINIFENSEEGFLEFNQYVVRPMSKDILNLRNNEEVKLTEKEVAVIKYLYKNRDRIVSKNELLQEVWGYVADVSTHTIETHIYRLRQKVEHDDLSAQLILTEDGGYQLKV